jgi:ABC-type multidrug transport system fused ATPase/permease subunit
MAILQMPVRQIGWMINSIARASTCGGRLFAVLDLEPSIADRPGANPLEITQGVLRFENVDFQYPAWTHDQRTLSGINLEARPGKTIGIVGPPGSGKSTVAHLMGRYYDVTGGHITIDGQDIRGVTLASLRSARLSIARSVMLDSAVLILDDSTAAVDAATEQRIRAALKDLVKERAVIIIAHRLSSLMHADEIVFLDEGRIVERGSHDELIALGGRYRELYDLQSSPADTRPLQEPAAED